jgi:drug/metabolite transporter (DMT)-like permease
MIWIIPALIGALTHTFSDIIAKSLLRDDNIWWVASVPYLIAGSLLLGISLLIGIPRIESGFLPAFLMTVGLNIIGTFLYYRSIHISDLSVVAPMLAFTPVFLILSGTIILHETPTVTGIAGIILVVIGSFLVTGMKWSKLASIRLFPVSGPAIMVFVAILYSFSTTFDKLIVQNSDPFFATGATLVVLGVIFFAVHKRKESRYEMTRRSTLLVVGISITIAIAAVSVCIAYTSTLVAYAIPIKRLSILFSVIAGGLVFHEPAFGWRLAGAGFMAIGAILISVAGI